MMGDKTVVVKLKDCEWVDPKRPTWSCPYAGTISLRQLNTRHKKLICATHAEEFAWSKQT